MGRLHFKFWSNVLLYILVLLVRFGPKEAHILARGCGGNGGKEGEVGLSLKIFPHCSIEYSN